MGVTRSSLLGWLLGVLGAALVIGGVTAVYWPAGLVTAGVLLLAALFLDLDAE